VRPRQGEGAGLRGHPTSCLTGVFVYCRGAARSPQVDRAMGWAILMCAVLLITPWMAPMTKLQIAVVAVLAVAVSTAVAPLICQAMRQMTQVQACQGSLPTLAVTPTHTPIPIWTPTAVSVTHGSYELLHAVHYPATDGTGLAVLVGDLDLWRETLVTAVEAETQGEIAASRWRCLTLSCDWVALDVLAAKVDTPIHGLSDLLVELPSRLGLLLSRAVWYISVRCSPPVCRGGCRARIQIGVSVN